MEARNPVESPHSPAPLPSVVCTLLALSYLTPWLLLCLALPPGAAWGWAAAVAALVPTLSLAAGLAARCAAARDLPVLPWALLAVVTLGVALLALSLKTPPDLGAPLQALCPECGRLGDSRAPFCYACGAR